MKKLLSLLTIRKTFLLLAFAQLLGFSALANPGDTTWVTVYNNIQLNWNGNWDTTVTLPTGNQYRKIRLHYILGRYACQPGAPGSPWCGSWDYTTQIHVRKPGMDTVEIARVITPYASTWPLTKKHDYIIDVTDYTTFLQGVTPFRFHYDGWSGGFTLTLRLEMIEGIPPMDALSVKNIYDGYYKYGHPINSIENDLVPKAFTYTSSATKEFIKNTVSGHGYDTTLTQCAEFCNKYYQLKIDNNLVDQKQLWRNDCGLNPEYQQNGTWVYERANWCPGAVVNPIYHDLSLYVLPNTTFTADVDMQPYISPVQDLTKLGGFNWVSQLINYSNPNFSNDVSIEDIVAPTKDLNFFRNNPTCTNPIVRIKNTGSTPVTSVSFDYGLVGGVTNSYTWIGALNFLEETDVTFSQLMPIFTNTADVTFTVAITGVNGLAGDDNLYNNISQSISAPTSIYPSSFIIRLFTNNGTNFATQKNQTSWELYDADNNLIVARNNLNNNSIYRDTVTLMPGCYRFKITDSECNGLAWQYSSDGNGSLSFVNINGVNNVATFSGDFGCGFDKYFTVLPDQTVGLKSFIRDNDIDLYPNPAGNMAYLKLDLNQSQDVTYKITDVNGRIVQQRSISKVAAAYENIDLSAFSNGVYVVSIQLQKGQVITKKLIVQK